jgi:hypothetical protein
MITRESRAVFRPVGDNELKLCGNGVTETKRPFLRLKSAILAPKWAI